MSDDNIYYNTFHILNADCIDPSISVTYKDTICNKSIDYFHVYDTELIANCGAQLTNIEMW